MRRFVIASLALIACGGAAPAPGSNSAESKNDETRIAKALEGFTPGKPVTCISQFRPTYSTETIGDSILYRVNNRLIYRNKTSGRCDNGSGSDALVLRNFGPQLCRGQIIQTVDLVVGFQTGACALGDFTPYTKAK
jgi:hypothetical protein